MSKETFVEHNKAALKRTKESFKNFGKFHKQIFKDLKGLKWYEFLYLSLIGAFLVLVSIVDLTTMKFTMDGLTVNFTWQGLPTWKAVLAISAGLSAFTGIVCVFLCGKGKITNYWWGFINVVLYGTYAFSVGYTGDALLNLVYYLPIQFIGIAMWKKHLNKKTETVISKRISLPEWGLYAVLTAFVFGIFWIVIPGVDVELNKVILGTDDYDYIFRDKTLPRVIDTLTNSLSIIAMLTMLRRQKGQWYIWIVVNTLQIIMFSGINGWGVNIPMIVMWGAFLLNSLYSLREWIKREKSFS